MPTYEYACTNPECGNRFERVQAFTDPSITSCPVCDQAVRKVYGNVGVVFKGSGFYRNDARAEAKSSNGSSAKGGDGAKSEGGKSDGAKSDSAKTTSSSDSSSSSSSSASSSSSSSGGSSSSSASSAPAASPAAS